MCAARDLNLQPVAGRESDSSTMKAKGVMTASREREQACLVSYDMTENMMTLDLNNGVEIPALGCGV